MFIGQCIRLRTNDEWNGLYGIVYEIVDDLIIIFCINKPGYKYFVRYKDANNVLEILDY